MKASSGRDLTPRFRAVLEHYGLRSSRITPGQAHENGIAEQAHRRLKALIAQALLVRGHAAFDDVAAYDAFVQEVVAYWRNRPAAARVAEERPALRALPSAAIASYTSYYPVAGEFPNVPQRRLNETVTAVVHPRPNPYCRQASVGDKDTPGVQSITISRGSGARLEPTSRTGHAAIGV